MALKKVAPSSQWESGAKGSSPSTFVLAHDAVLDQYYVAAGESADAYIVLDAGGDQYTVDTTRGGTAVRIVQAGAGPGRLLE